MRGENPAFVSCEARRSTYAPLGSPGTGGEEPVRVTTQPRRAFPGGSGVRTALARTIVADGRVGAVQPPERSESRLAQATEHRRPNRPFPGSRSGGRGTVVPASTDKSTSSKEVSRVDRKRENPARVTRTGLCGQCMISPAPAWRAGYCRPPCRIRGDPGRHRAGIGCIRARPA